MGLGDKKRPRGLDKSLLALIQRLTKDFGMVSIIGGVRHIGFLHNLILAKAKLWEED